MADTPHLVDAATILQSIRQLYCASMLAAPDAAAVVRTELCWVTALANATAHAAAGLARPLDQADHLELTTAIVTDVMAVLHRHVPDLPPSSYVVGPQDSAN